MSLQINRKSNPFSSKIFKTNSPGWHGPLGELEVVENEMTKLPLEGVI
jgi:hypothetical protein